MASTRTAPPSAPSAAPPGHLSASILTAPTALQDHVADWDDLATDAETANPFYESWMLLPALRHLGESPGVYFVLVHDRDASGKRRLCGLFPLRENPGYRRSPFRAVSLWRHRHCFLCTPLVRRGMAGPVLAALLDKIAGQAGLLELPLFDAADSVHGSLRPLLQGRGCPDFVEHTFARPVLRVKASAEHHLEGTISGQGRKRLRRQERQLSDRGAVEYVRLDASGDIEAWIDSFLALEAGGWKGRRGTALACRPGDRAFFEAVARAAFQLGRLMAVSLRVGGRDVAADCNFRAGRGAFAFKIAHDEAFARYSPGVLVEVHTLRRVHADPGLDWIDSCIAQDGHDSPLWRLYDGRRPITHLLCGVGDWPARCLVRWLPTARWAWRGLKRLLDRGREQIGGAHRARREGPSEEPGDRTCEPPPRDS